MHHRSAPARRLGVTAGLAAAALIVGILVPDAATATPAPPPNPTNGQLAAAAAAKAAATAAVSSSSATVGQLSGQVAAAQAELTALQGANELAEQKVAYAVSKQRDAEYKASVAVAASQGANAAVVANNTARVREVQAIYTSGETDGTVGALLQSTDPSALLAQSTMTNYIADNKVDAIGQSQRLAVAASNASAAARQAEAQARAATANAQAVQRAAAAAASLQAAREAQLQQTLATSQAELTAAQNTFSSAQANLATLTGQRATYEAYQRALAAQRAAAAAAAARARKLAAERAAAERRAAQQAAANRNHGGGGGGGGGSYSYSPPVNPVGGSWTAARGRQAVARARSTLGMPYAWAGGGSGGPSYGVCDASNGAPNDCNVYGYDCSGLAMFAWGPWISMDHYAATQYTQAGSYHPPLSQLLPGDLLFWSNGGIGGIHHVAIYIGHGQIIQAPYSGGYIEISSMYDPGTIFGATRPLT